MMKIVMTNDRARSYLTNQGKREIYLYDDCDDDFDFDFDDDDNDFDNDFDDDDNDFDNGFDDDDDDDDDNDLAGWSSSCWSFG